MKAAQYNKYGDPGVIEIIDNAIAPQLSPGQVLVEVHAASINPIDFKVREGAIPGVPQAFPATIGGDFAGIVKEVQGESSLKEGDKVFGQAGFLNGGTGSMADIAATVLEKVGLMPSNMDFTEAASLPLAAVSALQALTEHINLQKDQKILINGGAGGIGSFAIQIAKELGAYVATTISPDDVEFVKSLGADEVIDYKTQKVTDVLKDYDAVFDTAGPQTWDDSIRVLKKGGIIVSMNGQPNPQLAKELDITSIGQGTNANPEKLNKIKEMVESGKLKTNIDKVFSLDEARQAFEYQESQSPKGKVVIKIK